MEASGESLIYISRDTVVLSQCHDEVPIIRHTVRHTDSLAPMKRPNVIDRNFTTSLSAALDQPPFRTKRSNWKR